MRVLAESHMALRAAREQRRDDVADADGDARATAEDGQEHTRVMIFGPVRTSRIAYRRRGKANLYPQDADLNWAGLHSYSAGVEKRAAKASAVVPFEQAAVQVSAQGAVTLGKRQAEELAIGSVTDFDAFYASRLPDAVPAGDRAADHRGRVRVPRAAGSAAPGHREGRRRPREGRGGKRLAR